MLLGTNLLLPSTSPFCRHSSRHLQSSSEPNKLSPAPILSHPLQLRPAANPHPSSRPAAAYQATPPPQSTPSIYILLLLPTPVPSPALQQVAKQLHPLDIIPHSTALTSPHSPCPFPPHAARQASPRRQYTPTLDIPILLPPPLQSTVLRRAHQAAPPPQHFPTLYNPLLLPPPLPATVLQMFIEQLLLPNLLPASTSFSCCQLPCHLPPSNSSPSNSTLSI